MLMSQPIIRMANRTVQWIVQDFLFERFGRLTPLEMQDVNKSLDAFYFPETQSLPEHFGFHVQAHNTALANNAPFSERDKVAKLRDSLLSCFCFNSSGRWHAFRYISSDCSVCSHGSTNEGVGI